MCKCVLLFLWPRKLVISFDWADMLKGVPCAVALKTEGLTLFSELSTPAIRFKNNCMWTKEKVIIENDNFS